MSLDVPYRSIPDMLVKRVAATPDRKALAYPSPDGSGAVWLTWSEVSNRVQALAAALNELGVASEGRVVVMAGTRIDWVLADLAVLSAGGATTTIYPTTEGPDATFIAKDCGATVVIAENATLADKIDPAEATAIEQIVLIDGTADAGATPPRTTLAELEARGKQLLATDPELVNRLIETIKPEHLATLIYTSGTTGQPKGVELLHAGWCWEGVAQGLDELLRPDDLHYIWLPLSHVFGKTLITGTLHVGVPTFIDGRIDKLVENLPKIRPTLICAAPRVFEKIYNRAVTTATEAGGAKAAIFGWAVRVGREKVRLQQAGQPVPTLLSVQHAVADRLVFSKLRARLGGRIRILCSGSASLATDIAEFFAAADLAILEGYGLTEASAGDFINRPGRVKIGSVGQPLGDLECRIAEDGELQIHGKPVMRGYHNLPKETAEAFTEDGWLRTGDIAELDSENYLRLTDRKKDLFKTSGGKYIAPSHIEGLFKALCPFASQVVVIARGRNYCTMLVTLDQDVTNAWSADETHEHAGRSYAEIAAAPSIRAALEEQVKQLNSRLNRWETIKKFEILPRELTIEEGDLTPSMKVKRAAVESAFAEQIEGMYAGSVARI